MSITIIKRGTPPPPLNPVTLTCKACQSVLQCKLDDIQRTCMSGDGRWTGHIDCPVCECQVYYAHRPQEIQS